MEYLQASKIVKIFDVSTSERVHKGTVSEVVVRHKDRLCRYGLEIVEWIFQKAGTRLVVLSRPQDQVINDTNELADDLLSIVNVFFVFQFAP